MGWSCIVIAPLDLQNRDSTMCALLVNMGFHPDLQAIEAALGCVPCSTIFFTGKVGQSSLVHQCLDVFEGSFSCCQLEYMLLQAKQG